MNKNFTFHRSVREVKKDVKVVILLLGNNNTGELLTNLLGKDSRRNNWKTAFSRHWRDEEGWFASVYSGHQTAEFLENHYSVFTFFVHTSTA